MAGLYQLNTEKRERERNTGIQCIWRPFALWHMKCELIPVGVSGATEQLFVRLFTESGPMQARLNWSKSR